MVKVYREGFSASFALPWTREVRCSGLGELREAVWEGAADGVLPDRIWRESTGKWHKAKEFPFDGKPRSAPDDLAEPTEWGMLGYATVIAVVLILGGIGYLVYRPVM
jgi:hypothetical protein